MKFDKYLEIYDPFPSGCESDLSKKNLLGSTSVVILGKFCHYCFGWGLISEKIILRWNKAIIMIVMITLLR